MSLFHFLHSEVAIRYLAIDSWMLDGVIFISSAGKYIYFGLENTKQIREASGRFHDNKWIEGAQSFSSHNSRVFPRDNWTCVAGLCKSGASNAGSDANASRMQSHVRV